MSAVYFEVLFCRVVRLRLGAASPCWSVDAVIFSDPYFTEVVRSARGCRSSQSTEMAHRYLTKRSGTVALWLRY